MNIELTTEQQFRLRTISGQAQNLNHQQCIDYAVEATRQMIVKENLVREMLKGGKANARILD